MANKSWVTEGAPSLIDKTINGSFLRIIQYIDYNYIFFSIFCLGLIMLVFLWGCWNAQREIYGNVYNMDSVIVIIFKKLESKVCF